MYGIKGLAAYAAHAQALGRVRARHSDCTVPLAVDLVNVRLSLLAFLTRSCNFRSSAPAPRPDLPPLCLQTDPAIQAFIYEALSYLSSPKESQTVAGLLGTWCICDLHCRCPFA